ncbi:hypothetical protein ACIF80_22865 [Streptomyces sp. NPDC085927]
MVARTNGELVVWDTAGRLAFERLQNRPVDNGISTGTWRAGEKTLA